MPIKTNLQSLTSRRQKYKQEITLLSHGYKNQTAWPDGKIMVYPWDNAIDNYLLENIRRLSRQEMTIGLLRVCCDLNGGSVDEFISDEIMTVLLVSRALSTDGVVVYTASCPYCGAKKQEQVKVPAELEKVGEKTPDYPGFDLITLPLIKDVVKISPLTVKDERDIINRGDDKKKVVPDTELRTVMRVVDINEGKPDTLEELVTWYRALHTRDSKFLEDKGRELTPHLNTNIQHICDEPDCGRKFVFPLTFDQEFFR